MAKRALFLGIDSIKHDWPDQWMPVFAGNGFDVRWHSLGEYWLTALPVGPQALGTYDIDDIAAFAKWRGPESDGQAYAAPDLPDSIVLSVVGYLERLLDNDPPDLLCVWSHSTMQYRAATTIARRRGIPVFYFEGAFFCSPRTWTHMHIIDPIGVYFQGRSWLKEGWDERGDQPLSETQTIELAAFQNQWSRERRSKYEQSSGNLWAPSGKPMLFVPLQTPHDGTMWWPNTVINSPGELVRLIVDEATPEWFPVFKKHPRDNTPLDAYAYSAHAGNYALIDQGNIHDLIAASSGVALINSTVGLEALARGHRVLTLGDSFYSGEGWTEDVRSADDLPAGLQRLAQYPRVEGEDLERLHRFLHWILYTYLADFTKPRLNVRYEVALREAACSRETS